jgi:mediator of RNA polymerase II transcription subunit 5
MASFDVLAAAMERRESEDQMFTLKSFHTNKVPLLVSTLPASMFAPLTPEFCISQAMSHVDQAIFPSPSYGMMSESLLQDVRQEFLFACVLHSLLPSENVEALLGEAPFTPPPSPDRRCTKDGVVQQIVGDTDQLGQFVKQLETLDGNAGAIVAAVTEVSINIVITFRLLT